MLVSVQDAVIEGSATYLYDVKPLAFDPFQLGYSLKFAIAGFADPIDAIPLPVTSVTMRWPNDGPHIHVLEFTYSNRRRQNAGAEMMYVHPAFGEGHIGGQQQGEVLLAGSLNGMHGVVDQDAYNKSMIARAKTGNPIGADESNRGAADAAREQREKFADQFVHRGDGDKANPFGRMATGPGITAADGGFGQGQDQGQGQVGGDPHGTGDLAAYMAGGGSRAPGKVRPEDAAASENARTRKQFARDKAAERPREARDAAKAGAESRRAEQDEIDRNAAKRKMGGKAKDQADTMDRVRYINESHADQPRRGEDDQYIDGGG